MLHWLGSSLAERWILTPCVAGSIPARASNYFLPTTNVGDSHALEQQRPSIISIDNCLSIFQFLILEKTMKRNIKLKVKIKHLAEEARIIRAEERKANKLGEYDLQNSLHLHRTGKLRREARATLLAYQFLRGIPYAACEPSAKTLPDTKAFQRMCKDYGGIETTFEEWKQGKQLKAA